MEKYNKIRGKIKEYYSSEKKFSQAVGINNARLSRIFNGYAEFSLDDVRKICELLEIPDEEMAKYFLR